MDGKNIIKSLLKEATAYNDLDQIEKYIQDGKDLSHLPVQPLYLLFKNLPEEKAVACLTKLSSEQRTAFLDLDLWEKDELDIGSFSSWLTLYSRIEAEEIRYEFIKSEEFTLFLKSKLNLWTFDVEDPMYPDHDNYFLTEDNQLLVEFEEDYEFVEEIRNFIKDLYSELGVENAYSHLFKIITDSYLIMEEEEYSLKKGRLRDFGFVDYFDALEACASFHNLQLLDNFIAKKIKKTGAIDDLSKQQRLDSSALVAYKDKIDSLEDELEKISSEKRIEFLQFNFIRLVNSNIALNNALKSGPLALARVSERSKQYLSLGLSYLKSRKSIAALGEGDELFDRFDFFDLQKIGQSLLSFYQKKLKKVLGNETNHLEIESFLGNYWERFISDSFSDGPSYFSIESRDSIEINTVNIFEEWEKYSKLLIQLYPFVREMFEGLQELKKEGKLLNQFYFNYDVDSIDFEAIILSSFANFLINQSENRVNVDKKMGLTLKEYKKFAASIFNEKEELKNNIESLVNDFSKSFGLSGIENFRDYFFEILKDHLKGYEFDKMSDEDFKHVGGPIILQGNVHAHHQ